MLTRVVSFPNTGRVFRLAADSKENIDDQQAEVIEFLNKKYGKGYTDLMEVLYDDTKETEDEKEGREGNE